MTYDELQEIAEKNSVGDIYKQTVEGLTRLFDQTSTTMSTIAFIGIMDGSRKTIFSLIPGESDSDEGLRFQVYIDRFSEYFNVSKEDALNIFPPGLADFEPWKGATPTIVGHFKNVDQVGAFLKGLEEPKHRKQF